MWGFPESTFLVLFALFFLVPVPGTLRTVRTLEARRLEGLPEPTPAEQHPTGDESLDRLLQRPVRAARAR